MRNEDKETVLKHYASVFDTGVPAEFQYPYRKEQGGVIWYHSKVVKFQDGVVTTFMDITKRIMAEEKLLEKNKELEQVNREKDKLLSVLSHDLRNAISGPVMIYDFLLKEYEKLDREEILDYLNLLSKRSKDTFDLLEEMMAWSMQVLGKSVADIEPIDLVSVTDSVINNLLSSAREKGVSLKNQLPEGIIADGDVNLVASILRNLIINGIKFSHSGGNVVVTAERIQNGVSVSVVDEGVGISEVDIKKIFDKMSLYSTPGTNGEKGSGLGLSICIDHVEKLGGDIRVDSEPQIGSTFTFTLPDAVKSSVN